MTVKNNLFIESDFATWFVNNVLHSQTLLVVIISGNHGISGSFDQGLDWSIFSLLQSSSIMVFQGLFQHFIFLLCVSMCVCMCVCV